MTAVWGYLPVLFFSIFRDLVAGIHTCLFPCCVLVSTSMSYVMGNMKLSSASAFTPPLFLLRRRIAQTGSSWVGWVQTYLESHAVARLPSTKIEFAGDMHDRKKKKKKKKNKGGVLEMYFQKTRELQGRLRKG